MIEFGFSFILYMIFSRANPLTKKLHQTVFPTYYLSITDIPSGTSSNLRQAIFSKQLLLLSLCLKFLLERLQCSAVLDSEGFSGCRSKINTLCFVDIKH